MTSETSLRSLEYGFERLVLEEFSTFGTSGRHCSRLPLGGRPATTSVNRYFHNYFLHFFSFSPSRPFLIEGVLESKNLFSES